MAQALPMNFERWGSSSGFGWREVVGPGHWKT
jgi:hypothetical protein